MKKNRLLCGLLLLFLPYKAWGLIPMKGSPNRCQSKESGGIILPVDDLLPEHYSDAASMHTAIEKMRKITPNQMIQSVVDHLLSYHDFCGEKVTAVGGWEDSIGTALCERIGSFDATHDTMLSGLLSSATNKSAEVPQSDILFLQTVYKACRLSTDRYWNYPSLTHVSYQPSSEESAYINKAMGHDEWTF